MQNHQKKFTVSQLAKIIDAELLGSGDSQILRICGIEEAQADCITFAIDKKLFKNLAGCKAGAVIVPEKTDINIPQLIVPNVEKALIKVLQEFAPPLAAVQSGIHKTAIIEQDCSIAKTASIGAFVHIKKGAKIGENTVIASGCKIGENSSIGNNCRIEENTVIYHNVKIANHCVIAANCTIGATGFGYYFIDGRHLLIPHIGGVVIEDFVEIGANSCVDRAKFGNTTIGAGTKIDNLVQIAHNVQIGKCCLIIAQVGIAGSSKLGDGVVAAGQVGIKDNVKIGSGAQLGAQAGVMTDIKEGARVAGSPAIDIGEKVKQVLLEQKLPEMAKTIKQLVKRIENLEAAKNNSTGL